MKKHLITLLSLLILTACAEAPEEVQRENSILDEAVRAESQTEEALKHDRKTLDEIRAAVDDTLKNNKTNITVKKVNIGAGSVMPAYKAEPFNNNFDELGELIKYLFGEEYDPQSPKVTLTERDTLDADGLKNIGTSLWYKKAPPEMSDSLVYFDTGRAFWNAVTYSDPYRDTEYFPTEKNIRVYAGDRIGEESYIMTDGQEYTLKDAEEFAHSFLDKYISPLEKNEFTYNLTQARVKKLGDQFGYVFNYQRVDKKGNLYDDHTKYPINCLFDQDCNWIIQGMPYLYQSEINITVNRKDQINSFLKGHAPYAGEQTDSGERLIPLDTAINILSSRLAGGAEYTFETAELEYYYTALDCPGYDKGNDKTYDNAIDFNMLYSADVQIRPYWAFTQKNTFTDPQSNGNGSFEDIDNKLYLIDAITGELYIYGTA